MTKPPDISDVGLRGGFVEPVASPQASAPGADVAADLSRTDHANAREFVARHGTDFRFCASRGWLCWDGRRWARDERREVEFRFRSLVEAWVREARLLPPLEGQALHARARGAASFRAIRAVIELAKSDPRVAIADAELDAPVELLNVHNGTLDLRTLEIRPHDRGDLLTQLAGTSWDATATAPTWTAFLERATCGDAELQSFLARVAFSCLMGETREHAFFVLLGPGANGKTVFVDALQRALGDYAMQVDPRLLLANVTGGEGPTPGMASLRGARLVVANETEVDARLAEARIKELTGGGLVSARRPYGEPFQFRPRLTLVVVSNHAPRVRGSDEGIMRRMLVVPFDVVVPKAEQDADLGRKLDAELPGILAWAVREGAAVRSLGLCPPRRVLDATERLRMASDDVAAFLGGAVVVAPEVETPARELFRAFQDWQRRAGRPLGIGEAEFKRRLEARGFEQSKRSTLRWRGLALRWHRGEGGETPN